MAEQQFLSPGVFTEERDLTFLPQGIQEISGAFVGPTSKGPAFEPVLVDGPRDYREKFGTGDYYTDFAVPNYLEDAGSAYVVRLLGSDGYTSEAFELQLDSGALNTDNPAEPMTIGVLTPTRSLREDNMQIVDARIEQNLDLDTSNFLDTFDVSSDLNGTPTGFTFGNEGNELYVVTENSAEIVQFNLSTAYDISTASSPDTFTINEDDTPEDIFISGTGDAVFVVGAQNADVYQYDLNTNFEISSASFSNNSFDVSGDITSPTSIDFNDDGDVMIVSESGSTIYQYSLDSAFDLSGTVNTDGSFMDTNEFVSISGVEFNSSGTELLVSDDDDQTITALDLGSSFDITSAGVADSIDVSSEVIDLAGVYVNTMENALFTVDASDSTINFYEVESANAADNFRLEIDLEPIDAQNPTTETVQYILSLDQADDNYVLDFFGGDIEGVREVFFKFKFPELWNEVIEEASSATVDAQFSGVSAIDFDDRGFSHASTPWIVSQDQQPMQPETDRQELFKFHTLSDGNSANQEIKVSLQNIRYPREVPGSEYGTFDVIVRAFDDSDRSPEILETFTAVNLDPSSDNFIASVIGNRNRVFQDGKIRQTGEFENTSSYIRVEVNDEFRAANEGDRDELSHLIPWGFDNYQIPVEVANQVTGLKTRKINTVVDPEVEVVDENETLTQDPVSDVDPNDAIFDNRVNYGFDFGFEDNEIFLQPIATNRESFSDQEGLNQSFNFIFSDGYVNNDGTIDSIEFGDDNEDGFPVQERKFAVGFQGGFDGKDPTTPITRGEDITAGNSQGFDLSGYNAPGSEAYRDAFQILSNDDRFDINLLVTPGVIQDLHTSVVQSGIDMVEARGDVFYVFDAVGPDATIQEATQAVQALDSNYAATYFPWVRVRSRDSGRQMEMPPSVVIPRVYAFSDRNSAEWFAPAGLERGGIPEVIEPVLRLRKDERDELYTNRVNPIAEFQGQGTVVFGQKTLQVAPSALDRVNVRRLLIRVKKFVASTSRFLVFEQNVPATRNRFKNIVNPFLENIQQRQGLFAFRIEMDADNNPPEVIDRNELRGQIFLQPTRTAEFVNVQFNLLPTGAEFENL